MKYAVGDDVVARMWKRVVVLGENDCWGWTGATFIGGYGQIRCGKKLLYAHRLMYRATAGGLDESLVVRHSCDNPPCTNPRHLLLGTIADNNADRKARGRGKQKYFGEKHHFAKLSPTIVAEIRKSKESCGRLARRFGVSRQTIWSARKGVTWAGV